MKLNPRERQFRDDLCEAVGQSFGMRDQRIAALERRLMEIEQKSLVYAGTWDDQAEYSPGSLVSHAGSGWVSIAATGKGARPGRAPGWRLVIKGEVT